MTEDDVKQLFAAQLESFISCIDNVGVRANLQSALKRWRAGDTTRPVEGPPRPAYDITKSADWARFCARLDGDADYRAELLGGAVPHFAISKPWGTISAAIHSVHDDDGLSLLVSAYDADGNESASATGKATTLLRKAGFGIGAPRAGGTIHIRL